MKGQLSFDTDACSVVGNFIWLVACLLLKCRHIVCRATFAKISYKT